MQQGYTVDTFNLEAHTSKKLKDFSKEWSFIDREINLFEAELQEAIDPEFYIDMKLFSFEPDAYKTESFFFNRSANKRAARIGYNMYKLQPNITVGDALKQVRLTPLTDVFLHPDYLVMTDDEIEEWQTVQKKYSLFEDIYNLIEGASFAKVEAYIRARQNSLNQSGIFYSENSVTLNGYPKAVAWLGGRQERRDVAFWLVEQQWVTNTLSEVVSFFETLFPLPNNDEINYLHSKSRTPLLWKVDTKQCYDLFRWLRSEKWIDSSADDEAAFIEGHIHFLDTAGLPKKKQPSLKTHRAQLSVAWTTDSRPIKKRRFANPSGAEQRFRSQAK